MEIGGVARTSPAAGQQLAARPEPASTVGAVSTQLVPAKAVQQGAAVPEQPVRYERNDSAAAAVTRAAAVQSFIENRNVYDAKTRQVIFRAVNTATGEVINQYPDDVALKLRAFVRDINDKQALSDESEATHKRVERVA